MSSVAPAAESAGALRSPDPLAGLHALELRVIVWLQGSGEMGSLMRWITDLGPGKPMWLVVAVLLCAVDLKLAARTLLMVVLCLWLRELLALILQSPRPYWVDPMVRTFRDPPITHPTHGLPSGHAMSATAFWLFLAWEVRRRWAWIAAVIIALAVCYSRVYLGLHFISDVVLGFVLGGLWVVAFRRFETPLSHWWVGQSHLMRLASAGMIGAGLAMIPKLAEWALFGGRNLTAWGAAGDSARYAGSCFWSGGAVCGVLLALAWPVVWTGVGDPWRLRMGRLVVGGIPAILYFLRPSGLSLSVLLEGMPGWVMLSAKFCVAAAAGWCGWWLLPRVFGWVGLARLDEESRIESAAGKRVSREGSAGAEGP